MNWEKEFIDVCSKYQIEPVQVEGKFLFICPKVPDEKIQQEILSTIPKQVEYNFIEQPRISTTEALKELLGRAGASGAEMSLDDHIIKIEISSKSEHLTDKDSTIWEVFPKILNSDPFIEGWEIKVNGSVMSQYDKKVAEMLAKRTINRDVGFTPDDILNLRITLESCEDVNDFINSI